MPAPVQAAYGTREYYQEIGRRGGLATAAKRAAQVKNSLMAELQSIVAEVAEQARHNASWSNDIRRAIETGTVTETEEGIECIINVNLTTAPQAAAFEYGSGIHGKKAHTYPITAKNKPLAFQFGLSAVPRPEKFIRMAGITGPGMLAALIEIKGRVTGLTFWKQVDHPGVEAFPYLQPAIDQAIPQLTDRIGRAFVASLRGMFSEEE